MQHKVSPATRLSTAQEIIPFFRAPYRFYYMVSKHQVNTYGFQHQILTLKSKKTDGIEILPYQFGILICTMEIDEKIFMEKLKKIGIRKEEYIIGVSTGCFETDKVANEIREALYAQRYASRNKKMICKFSEMGIWQMILPNRDNIWIQKYCEGLLQKLKSADCEFGTEIFDTISIYVANNCDTKNTAAKMSVHANTIRYRIKKAQEVLKLEGNEMEFQQAIWFAFNYKIGIDSYFDTF